MRPAFALLLVLLPFLSQAQYWRVQASGGVAVGLQLGSGASVYVGRQDPRYVSPGLYTGHIPEGHALLPAWSLGLARRMGNFELGAQVEALSLRSKWQTQANIENSNGQLRGTPVTVTGYVGRPVVPLTLSCNYYAGPKRGSAFIGIHAGPAFAAGRQQADFADIEPSTDIRLYYNDAWGFCAGIQAGYRKELGPIDIGFQLQAKYLQFSLTHGSSATKYDTKMLALPVQLYAGYRFGQKPVKPVAAPAE